MYKYACTDLTCSAYRTREGPFCPASPPLPELTWLASRFSLSWLAPREQSADAGGCSVSSSMRCARRSSAARPARRELSAQ